MNLHDWFSPLAILLGSLAVAGVVSTWFALRSWGKLPTTVAHHFDLLGRPDSFGNKRILWVLPVTVTAMSVFLAVFGLWDFSRRGEAIDRMRLNVETLMGVLAFLAGTILFVTRRTVNVALGRKQDLGRWALPAILGAVALLIFVGSLRLR